MSAPQAATTGHENHFERELVEGLSRIRKRIEDLHLPSSVFLGIEIGESEFHIAEVGAEKKIILHKHKAKSASTEALFNWLKNFTKRQNTKIVAAAIIGGREPKKLASRLWLEEDIVSYIQQRREKTVEERISAAALSVAANFNADNSFEVRLGPRNEVQIAELVTIEDYKKTVTKKEFDTLLALAERFRGKRLLFISATPQGGGVALMRHGTLRLLRLLGVNVSWHVLLDRKEIFEITKTKFHNVLQDVASAGTKLTSSEKRLLDEWSSENAYFLKDVIKESDVIVIDDPQPSGLVPHIKKMNPGAKLIYRSHIHLVAKLADTPGTSQYVSWSFIWSKIKAVDLFVSHPVEAFVPKVVDRQNLVFMPPSTDPLDGLNKPQTYDQLDYYLNVFDKMLLENGQEPLDRKRPYIIQIARFDPSKGIPDLVESYRKLRKLWKNKKSPPQLVIVGNGSVDDPDGTPILNLILSMLAQDKYRPFASDIKLLRIQHYDQVLNALHRGSKVAFQLSHKEGFEDKITGALLKGIPTIICKAGGMPLQVKDGVNGYVVKVGNTSDVAQKLYGLLTNRRLYQKMSKAASREFNRHALTIPNATNWLFLATKLLEDKDSTGNGAYVRDRIF